VFSATLFSVSNTMSSCFPPIFELNVFFYFLSNSNRFLFYLFLFSIVSDLFIVFINTRRSDSKTFVFKFIPTNWLYSLQSIGFSVTELKRDNFNTRFVSNLIEDRTDAPRLLKNINSIKFVHGILGDTNNGQINFFVVK